MSSKIILIKIGGVKLIQMNNKRVIGIKVIVILIAMKYLVYLETKAKFQKQNFQEMSVLGKKIAQTLSIAKI